MNPKNLYNIMTLNLEPLSRWTASEMITYLYGESMLKQVSASLKYSAADMQTRLIQILQTDLLATTPVQKMLGPLSIEKMHDKYIIPASAITQQCIDDKERIITIPIQAFEGKSLIALEVGIYTNATYVGPADDQPMHYYILLQSAKDPSILQPIRMMIGERTKQIKINLCSSELREAQGWTVQVSHPGTLQKVLDYYNKPEGTSHTDTWAIRTGKRGLSIPIQPTDRTLQQYLDSITADVIKGRYPVYFDPNTQHDDDGYILT